MTTATAPRRSGIRYQRWRALAACRAVDPALFFPEPGRSTEAARAVCACCPVRAQCLAYSQSVPELYGVFGGLPEDERRAMRSGSRVLCANGEHPMTPENTYLEPSTGTRRCLACKQATDARYRLQRKQRAREERVA